MRRKITPIKRITPTKKAVEAMTNLIAKVCNYHQYSGTHAHEVHRVSLSQYDLASPVRILHLSDFHASPVVPYRFIEQAVELGISLQPDLICLTGDFCTHRIPPDWETYCKILSKLPGVAPTFSCFGNHDCCFPGPGPGEYRDTLGVAKLLRAAGIGILFNAAVALEVHGLKLRVAGLGDLSSQTMFPERVLTRRPAMAETAAALATSGALPEGPDGRDDAPLILLSHNPDSKDFLTEYHWDVMLCGHTHGGQFRTRSGTAPFAPVRDGRFVEGLHRWEGRWIYITRGVGNVHGLRINCPPQISLLEIG